MNIKLLTLVFIVVTLSTIDATAQRVGTTPVSSNAVLQNFQLDNPNYEFQPELRYKFGTRIPNTLPFFDDFFKSRLYPDSTKWLNNQVFVNNGFGVHPPTYNVATFDVLDATGRPYNLTLNHRSRIAGDSLISQPINLLQDTAGNAYNIADSIVLSFFYQPNGFGHNLDSEDSFRLFFLDSDSIWRQVWEVGGVDTFTEFQHVALAIDKSDYLHKDFQFMFTTHSLMVGNANHWNIDYIYIDTARSVTIDYYDDYAIQTRPNSLIRDYSTMPYDHFSAAGAGSLADKIWLRVSNLDNVIKNINMGYESKHNGNSLTTRAPATSANNVNAQSSQDRFQTADGNVFGLPSVSPVAIIRTVEVEENGAGQDKRLSNNILTVTQDFDDYYAYDDGTAEAGFGWIKTDNEILGRGQIAYGFDIAKADSLFAIGTYFNESIFDVSTKRFRYRIWKNIEGVNGAGADEVIYESEELNPEYHLANGRRDFVPYYLDSSIYIEAGRYYIGWVQTSIFHLNVGWDKNFGNRKDPEMINPNLYSRFESYPWKTDDNPTGTLMMRPHFGTPKELYAAVPIVKKSNNLRMYPNPATSVINFDQLYSQVCVIALDGKQQIRKNNISQINTSVLVPGMYSVIATNENGELFKSKLVILAP